MTDPWTDIDKGNKSNETLSTGIEGEAEIGGGAESSSLEDPKVEEEALKFEDNFEPSTSGSNLQQSTALSIERNIHPLPDSEAYLESLERKLKKIRKDSKLVEALAEKRQDCWRALLEESNTNQSSGISDNNERFEFDAPLNNGDSTVQEIYRHLQPVQPVTVGETVHIVRHDQLNREYEELTEEEDAPASR